MTEHPGDNVDNRSRAFWAGVLAFVAFGIVLVLIFKIFGAGSDESAIAEPPLTAVDQDIIDSRLANLEAVKEAQGALVTETNLERAKAAAIAALAEKKPAKTEVRVVPIAPAPADAGGEAATEGEAAKPEAEGSEKAAEEKPE